MNESIDSQKNFNYLFGLINLAVVFCIVWLLWYVFLHPNAVMKLYTPMYGFSLIVALLTVIVLMNNVAGYYPFAESAPEGMGLFARGIILTVVSILLMLVLI
ncbi:MAG: hypothetical protein JRD84_03460 [Deltaproteobacteria bacterium]|nr:hypothetical protein [Deltaproteobacteria bacterium]